MRLIPILILALLAPGPLAAQNPLSFVEAGQWDQAEAAARPSGPLAVKLITFYRLLAPNAASAGAIAAFARQNPVWPMPALMERRRQEALAAEPDDAVVARLCQERRPVSGPALFRCANALANTGRGQEAARTARDAWVLAISDPGTEAAFLRRFPGLISPADQWARFQRLAWTDPTAAQRQIAFLDPAHAARAAGRLALKENGGIYTAAPAEEPGGVLDLARAYRKAGQDQAALAVWRASGTAAQKAAPDHLDLFWTERHLLTRKLLAEGNAAGAYDLISAHGQTDPATVAEAEFLAGFIALRRLNDPRAAASHFTALAAASPAVLTQSRAHYWLGRAAVAAGGDGRSEFSRSAAWPMTFYGQLAAREAGISDATLVSALRSGPSPGTGFSAPASTELARAATQLLAWGDPRRARPFLLRIEEFAASPQERIGVGDYATALGFPDVAVSITRRLGRDGFMPPAQGWPTPYEPPPVPEPAASLAIMRQESNFDAGIVSPSGALGLMQLMPATASVVARRLGTAAPPASLLGDPGQNMRIGAAYLREVLEKFDNSMPLATAAYNAGPHRVTQWLADNGDPRLGGPGMIDWIEMIPFNETRNYVQRVLENLVVYQARGTGTLPATMGQWSR